MIFDYLHAGYTAPARWLTVGDQTITLRWYKAAAGAATYTGIHAFGSTYWDNPDDIADTGPGEVPRIFTWSGSPPNVPPGLSTPTPAEWFQFGVPPNTPAPPCDTHVFVSACSCFSVLQS